MVEAVRGGCRVLSGERVSKLGKNLGKTENSGRTPIRRYFVNDWNVKERLVAGAGIETTDPGVMNTKEAKHSQQFYPKQKPIEGGSIAAVRTWLAEIGLQSIAQ